MKNTLIVELACGLMFGDIRLITLSLFANGIVIIMKIMIMTI